MTNSLALEERVTTLEYAVFHQFPATMAAMTHGTTHMRFQKVDGQFKAVHAEINHRFAAVDQRLDTLDAKLDTILGELRKPAR
jgi:tetrahydromethanopterin S-methyltransferase subunit G